MKTTMRGTLLMCTQMDPNHHLFPLAVGIVAGNEDVESWTWFCKQLKNAVPEIGADCMFVSDRDKGLKEAVPLVFPLSLSLLIATVPTMLRTIQK